jgi:hypothetical protein
MTILSPYISRFVYNTGGEQDGQQLRPWAGEGGPPGQGAAVGLVRRLVVQHEDHGAVPEQRDGRQRVRLERLPQAGDAAKPLRGPSRHVARGQQRLYGRGTWALLVMRISISAEAARGLPLGCTPFVSESCEGLLGNGDRQLHLLLITAEEKTSNRDPYQ